MMILALFHLEYHVKLWMQAGGYGALFILLFSCGLGLPLPEDIPIITAGVMIANHHMHWGLAAPVAWLGIISGDCVLYYLGWRFGYGVTKLPVLKHHVTVERIERAEVLFERFGILVVGVGRMVAGIRGAMVIAAGTTRYKFIKFIIADGIGAVISGGLFMYVGFWAGSNVGKLKSQIETFRTRFLLCGIVLLAAIITFIWYRMKKSPANSAPVHGKVLKPVEQPAGKRE